MWDFRFSFNVHNPFALFPYFYTVSVPSKPTYKEALKFWWKLGWISFGGPAGQIAIMHTFLVDKKKWISDKKFLHALNYCMLLPGPEAQQLATYTGWLLHGKKGGLTAGLLFILPSVFILLALSIIYVEFGNISWVNALFEGLKPAIVAIVLVALFKIAKRALQSRLHYVVAILSFIAIFFFNVHFPIIIIITILLALFFRQVSPKIFIQKSTQNEKLNSEEGYYLTTESKLQGTQFKWKSFGLQTAVFICLWVIPFGIFYVCSGDFIFWRNLSLFFTQAAFVTFGGAYAVLPYVAQQAVDNMHWLNSLQMIDGLALGETTPGPLVIVLSFVGFMAAYGNYGNSIFLGGLGLLVTTYYTFLSCFYFIFAGAPLIEKTQHKSGIKVILSFVTAAVTGVILNLTLYFAEAVLFGKNHDVFSQILWSEVNYVNCFWILLSFLALYRFKLDMMLWIGVSALFGLITNFVF